MRNIFRYFYAPSFPPRIGRIRFIAISGINFAFFITYATSFRFYAISFDPSVIINIFVVMLYILSAVNQIILCIKRLHDINCSGWWATIFLIPILNILFCISLITYPGNKQDNKFGAPPSKLTVIEVIVSIVSLTFAAIAMTPFYHLLNYKYN